MRQPGLRLRAFAARFCNARTMERLIDPLIADLQVEYADMRRGRAPWKAQWVRLVSLLAFAKVVAVAGIIDAWRAFDAAPPRRAVGIAIVFAVAAVVPTIYFVYAQQAAADVLNPHANRTLLAIYLTPSVLPLTVAIGLTFAVVCGMRTVAALGGAAVCSILMLGNMIWIVPDSNQAYRELVYGGPVQRGDHELTYGELRRRIELRPDDVRRLEIAYYQRGALAAAPVMLAAVALAAVRRPRLNTALRRVFTAAGICVGYYLLLIGAEETGIWTMWPVALVTWSPNIACALLAGALAKQRHLSVSDLG